MWNTARAAPTMATEAIKNELVVFFTGENVGFPSELLLALFSEFVDGLAGVSRAGPAVAETGADGAEYTRDLGIWSACVWWFSLQCLRPVGSCTNPSGTSGGNGKI